MAYCAKCGAPLSALKHESDTPPINVPAHMAQPDQSSESPPYAGDRITAMPGIVECRIVDIDIPFWSMVNFMVKWAIAAIPALIALFILSVLALAVLSAIGVSIKN